MSESERFWGELVSRLDAGELSEREREVLISAEENAGMTGDERGYKDFSPEWYEVFAASYQLLIES